MVKSWYDKTCKAAVLGLTVKEAAADSKVFCCSTVPEMEISNNVSGTIKQQNVFKPTALTWLISRQILNTARPRDTQPLGARTLQIRGFELGPKTLKIHGL